MNGRSSEFRDGITVAELLVQLELLGAVAVEVNEEVVPRRRHAEHTLCDGDRLEVVTLVGGG